MAATAPSPLRLVASFPTMPECISTDGCSSSNDCSTDSPLSKTASESQVDAKVHSSETPAVSTGTDVKPPLPEGHHPTLSLKSLLSIPSIVVSDAESRPSSRWSERIRGSLQGKRSGDFDRKAVSPPPPEAEDEKLDPIALNLPPPTLDGMQSMEFPHRGSFIQKPKQQPAEPVEQKDAATGVRRTDTACSKPGSLCARRTSLIPRAISADEDMLSRRVRLMYEKGIEDVSDEEVARAVALENGVLWEEGPEVASLNAEADTSTGETETKSVNSSSIKYNPVSIPKEAYELAGGIEYWQDIRAGDVDRYGFIRQQTANSSDGVDANPLQRVSTSLLLASQTPRRKRSLRPPTAPSGNRPFTGLSPTRKTSDTAVRPTSSQSGYSPPLRRTTSRLRFAANYLPHNRTRKFKDEASDMLTPPVDVINDEDAQDTPITRSMRKKEWRREDKWTKMAKPTKKNGDGGGTTYEFDTQSSKLVERTWKGIPDRWRATAWYAFLEASAKRRQNSPTEAELIEAFHEFQYISSPDDVQIDLDVPRTITSHIMFRRRYRGGQRLLFRVLHAMSLYFPDTGYVQGMAALAATLLAYYDEEHTFIMLVRLWQLRGLEQLYKSGFAGLMEALDDFEREWLEKGEVAAKLNELGIPPTSYGTRWYLTLFNYSIPFPAQLRVWDVFMLLGDAEDPVTSRMHHKHSKPKSTSHHSKTSTFGVGLDVLHATSAALIDGMRDIILESDFENAMKVLTSWVPIKDVELFMRVARAEWKVHHRKKAGLV